MMTILKITDSKTTIITLENECKHVAQDDDGYVCMSMYVLMCPCIRMCCVPMQTV